MGSPGFEDDDDFLDEEDEDTEFEDVEFMEDDEDILTLKNRYDDDHLKFYTSNLNRKDYKSENDFEYAKDEQPLGFASTYDILCELDKRFDQIAFIGKRVLKDKKVITGQAYAPDRDPNRGKKETVDNRFTLRGDIHTLYGMIEELRETTNYCMGEGLSYIKLGYGPDKEVTDMNGM